MKRKRRDCRYQFIDLLASEKRLEGWRSDKREREREWKDRAERRPGGSGFGFLLLMMG